MRTRASSTSSVTGRRSRTARSARIAFRHPVVGEISVDCDRLTLAERDQHLVLYSAPPGSPDANALALLNVLGAEAGDHRQRRSPR
ncbi:hypothetical protein [Streptomyces sp. NPDC051286]|uniref:MmyB family transcriptional regulator n=1 Tax=Streptomyces sp. NPDC051286 TaxID=3365647 RepID=UPI00378FB710